MEYKYHNLLQGHNKSFENHNKPNILKLGLKWSVKSWHTKRLSMSFLSKKKKINKGNED